MTNSAEEFDDAATVAVEESGTTRVEFYSGFESHSFRTLDVHRSTTALDVLQMLLAEDRCGHCTNVVIIEWKRASGMHRIVEDHEAITECHETWHAETDAEHNRFVVKQDYCKYEVFRNPRQFLPEGMLNLSNEKFQLLAGEHPAAPNSFLRSLILSTSWHPEVEGSLHYLEKKSWKKLHFLLRPSGLYSTAKHSSKDPKHLSFVCSLEELHIYQVEHGRKLLGAPSDNVICLMGTFEDGGLSIGKYFCFEDEEMLRNWRVAFRLHKYGKQLQENYQSATQADQMLHATENIKELAIQEKAKSRVAMDFTGAVGRVVDDPQEAIAALVAELHAPSKKRKTGRCLDAATSPNQFPVHIAQAWYHGGMSREEATRVLGKQGHVDGVFLVRKSRSQPGAYVLSFTLAGKTKHHTISNVKVDEHLICLTLDEGKTKFADLTQLVEFYQLNPGALCTRLTYPVKVTESPKR